MTSILITWALITWPWRWSHDLDIDHMTLTLITWAWHWSHELDIDHMTIDHMTLMLIAWRWHWSHDLDVDHMTLMCLSSQHKVSKSMHSIVRGLIRHTDWQPFLLVWPWPWTSDHQLDVDIMFMKSEVTKSRLWNIRASDTRTHRHRRDLTHDHAACLCYISYFIVAASSFILRNSVPFYLSMYVCPQGYWCS